MRDKAIMNAWLGGTSFLGAFESIICLRSPLHTRITQWCSRPLLAWRTWRLVSSWSVAWNMGAIWSNKSGKIITDAVLMLNTICDWKNYRKPIRAHHHHHAAVASFLSISSDYNTSKEWVNSPINCWTAVLHIHYSLTAAAQMQPAGNRRIYFFYPSCCSENLCNPPRGFANEALAGKSVVCTKYWSLLKMWPVLFI